MQYQCSLVAFPKCSYVLVNALSHSQLRLAASENSLSLLLAFIIASCESTVLVELTPEPIGIVFLFPNVHTYASMLTHSQLGMRGSYSSLGSNALPNFAS